MRRSWMRWAFQSTTASRACRTYEKNLRCKPSHRPAVLRPIIEYTLIINSERTDVMHDYTACGLRTKRTHTRTWARNVTKGLQRRLIHYHLS